MRFLRKLLAVMLGGAAALLCLISSHEPTNIFLYKALFIAALCLYVSIVIWIFAADIRAYSAVKKNGRTINALCESNEASLFWRNTRFINFLGQTYPELSAEIDGKRESIEPIGWFDESICKKGDITDVIYWEKNPDFVILPGQTRRRAFVINRLFWTSVHLAFALAMVILFIWQRTQLSQ